MRRFGVLAVVAVLCCVWVVGVSSALAFQGPWVAPVDLSVGDQDAISPHAKGARGLRS
jgi:hypothetical protein